MAKRKLPQSSSFLENELNEKRQGDNPVVMDINNNELISTKTLDAVKNTSIPKLKKIANLKANDKNVIIRAKIESKSNIITFGTTGRLVELVFRDETAQIRGLMFRAAMEKFFDQLQEGQIVELSGFSIHPAHKDHVINEQKLEIELINSSQVSVLTKPRKKGPRAAELIKISEIKNKQAEELVTILGVVIEKGPRLIQKNTALINIVLIDVSGCRVRCTLWGNLAEEIEKEKKDNPMVVIENGRVKVFDDKFISSDSHTRLFLCPDFEEADDLLLWFFINKNFILNLS